KGEGRGPFPVINSITVEPQPVLTSATLSANASDPSGGPLTYSWTVGGVQVANGADAVWNSPGIPGEYLVGLTVTNSQGAIATGTASMMVGSQSPWPRFRRTIQATALSAVDTSADTGSVEWMFTPTSLAHMPSGFGSSPAIGPDGTIYASGGCGDFYALNPDGSQKWNFPTSRPIYSSPAIGADGTIYFASNDGTFYALNPDGTQKWNFTLTTLSNATVGPDSAGVSTPAIGTDGTIYVGCNSSGASPVPPLSVYYALNPNGTQKWKFDMLMFGNVSYVKSAAIEADGTIYVGTVTSPPGGYLVAIKPDGTLRWTAGNAPFSGSPAIGADGTVYDSTGTEGGGIGFPFFAFNPGGSIKWTFPQGGSVGALFSDSAIGADGTIYAGFSAIGGESSFYSLDALNPDGTQKWSAPIAGPPAGAPAIGADGTLYVAAGSLYAIH